MTTGLYLWYWVTTLVLAAVLYKPVKRVIVTGRIRKFERKLQREATGEEMEAIEKKAIPLVVVIVMTFSFLFNKVLMGKFFIQP